MLPGAKCSQWQSQQDIKNTPHDFVFQFMSKSVLKIRLSVLAEETNTFHDVCIKRIYSLHSIHG